MNENEDAKQPVMNHILDAMPLSTLPPQHQSVVEVSPVVMTSRIPCYFQCSHTDFTCAKPFGSYGNLPRVANCSFREGSEMALRSIRL